MSQDSHPFWSQDRNPRPALRPGARMGLLTRTTMTQSLEEWTATPSLDCPWTTAKASTEGITRRLSGLQPRPPVHNTHLCGCKCTDSRHMRVGCKAVASGGQTGGLQHTASAGTAPEPLLNLPKALHTLHACSRPTYSLYERSFHRQVTQKAILPTPQLIYL